MGGNGGGFPIDLVLFGMIAAFLVLRLRSILGRRTGFERPADSRAEPMARAAAPDARAPDGPIIDAKAEPVAPTRVVPDPASPTGQTLGEMRTVDRNFDPARFLDNAEAAFRLIVNAFAAGDRVALRPLLSDETYRSFEGAIAARENTGETQRTEVRAVQSAAIETADLRGSTATVAVRFVSDQVNLTLGRDGQPVAGTDAVTEITDVWTFERELHSTDPVWRLVAARSG